MEREAGCLRWRRSGRGADRSRKGERETDRWRERGSRGGTWRPGVFSPSREELEHSVDASDRDDDDDDDANPLPGT